MDSIYPDSIFKGIGEDHDGVTVGGGGKSVDLG